MKASVRCNFAHLRNEKSSVAILRVVFLEGKCDSVSLLLLSRFLPRLKSPMGDRGEGRKRIRLRGKELRAICHNPLELATKSGAAPHDNSITFKTGRRVLRFLIYLELIYILMLYPLLYGCRFLYAYESGYWKTCHENDELDVPTGLGRWL